MGIFLDHIGDAYPKLRAAGVQAAPVFLNRDATIEKMEGLVSEAAGKGADLVVFGESFVPAFPLWNMVYPPMDQQIFFRRLFDNALEIPSPQFEKIAGIARENKVFLSVGVTEKAPYSMGTMWNSNLLFDRTGRLVNHRRKLVPTWAEKLTWANGDAEGLEPARTEIGRIGVLICGENTNPLARYAMLAQGEQIHIATYPPAFPFKRPGASDNYDLTEAIRIRSAAHSFEGKVFNIVVSCALDESSIEGLSMGNEEVREILEKTPRAATMMLGPQGEHLCDPLVGKEGTITAEIDVSRSIEHKQVHDIVGYYNRFDIFRLELDKSPRRPVWIRDIPVRKQKDCEHEETNEVGAEGVQDDF